MLIKRFSIIHIPTLLNGGIPRRSLHLFPEQTQALSPIQQTFFQSCMADVFPRLQLGFLI